MYISVIVYICVCVYISDVNDANIFDAQTFGY